MNNIEIAFDEPFVTSVLSSSEKFNEGQSKSQHDAVNPASLNGVYQDTLTIQISSAASAVRKYSVSFLLDCRDTRKEDSKSLVKLSQRTPNSLDESNVLFGNNFSLLCHSESEKSMELLNRSTKTFEAKDDDRRSNLNESLDPAGLGRPPFWSNLLFTECRASKRASGLLCRPESDSLVLHNVARPISKTDLMSARNLKSESIENSSIKSMLLRCMSQKLPSPQSSKFGQQQEMAMMTDSKPSDEEQSDVFAIHKLQFPRFAASFFPSNLGIDASKSKHPLGSIHAIAPFGSPFFFNFLRNLSQSEFIHLARSVARYRRTSRLDATPSTVVSINLCSCCTPHSSPVSAFSCRTQFWSHEVPHQAPLPGAFDSYFSVMLVELHPELNVVEFLDRRLPAVIRQQVGNRLDRNFVVQILGISFTRCHLNGTWTIGDLPECTAADIQRLCSNPLYQHMLTEVGYRSQVPAFRNLNLCPIQYVSRRNLPFCTANKFVQKEGSQNFAPFSSIKSTACSSSETLNSHSCSGNT